MNFQDYIKSMGWIPNRLDDNFFSSHGALTVTYSKGNKKIIYGLNENKKPTTIIWPRPFGIMLDDCMINYLAKYGNEITLNSLDWERSGTEEGYLDYVKDGIAFYR